MSGLSPFRRGPGMGNATSDFARELENIAILNGRMIEFESDGTGNPQFINHGLGRVYRGAFCIGQSNVGGTVQVATPEATSDAGGDPSKVVRVDHDGALVFTIRLWVF